LKIYRVRTRFDVNRYEEFLPWARAVARNRCIDLMKARGRRMEIPVKDMEMPCEARQVRVVADRQVRQAVDSFVAGLKPEEQRFFELCFVRELAHEEIGRRLGISARRSKYLKKKMLTKIMRSAALRRLSVA
jgi:RNA polymerase sigma factor (sigma-70 family)